MLNVTLGQKIDPIDEAQKWLLAPGICMKMRDDTIQIDGNLDNEHIQNISTLDIAKMSNGGMNEQITPVVIRENGRSTRIEANFNGNDNEYKKIRPAQVWTVDFGQPVGNEFGYPHPAIVLGKSSTNNCTIVLPCSSKAKYGKVYQMKFTEDTLKLADAQFLADSVDKDTYVLFDQQMPVDRIRFSKYLGTLDENVFQDILRTLGKKDDEVKRRISMDSIPLTEKQKRILEITNRNSDLLGIANNEAFSYEQRVRGILSVFGFNVQLGGDVEFLENLVKNTRDNQSNYINLPHEVEILTRGTILTAQNLTCKLVELVKKRFRDVHPCLLEFVTLVNKLAS